MNYKKILFISGLILIGLFAFFSIGAPFYAKYYINKNGKELTGRKISIDKFYFNIINGKSDIENFRMYEEDDSTVFAKFDTLHINIALYKILTRELYIEEFDIDNPTVNIISQNNIFNFESLTATDSTQAIDSTSSNENPFIKYSINNISINSGDVLYTNLDDSISHNINKFDIKLPRIAWGEKNTNADLEFSLANGGNFKTSINYLSETGDFDWNVDMRNLNLNEFLPYLESHIKLSDLQGKLSAIVNVSGNTSNPTEPVIKGEISLESLKMTDNENLDFLSIAKAKLKAEKLNLKTMDINIDSLYIDQADITFHQYDKITNIDRLFYEQAQETVHAMEDSTVTEEGSSIKWHVNNLNFDNSKINFSDYSIKPKEFNYTLSEIQIKGENIKFGNRVKFTMLSSTPGGGQFNADITTDPGNINDGQFNLFLKNIAANDFSPYGLYYFGYPIMEGKYDFSIKNSVKDNHINSIMTIDAYATKLDDKRKDLEPQYNVPLKTALVIIRDKNNRINFDIPMEGDLDDPDFKYGKTLIKIFTNLMVKVAVSPFNILAKGLGVDEDEIKTIKYDELQYELGPSQTTQLDIIAKLLKEKTPLKADIQLYVDTEDEKEKLTVTRAKSHFYLKKLYNNDTLFSKLTSPDYALIEDIDMDNVGFNKYLSNKLNIPQDSLSNEKMCSLLITKSKIEDIYTKLNKRRINNIKSYLTKTDSINFEVLPKYIDKRILGNPYFALKYSMED
ncbi:MAG: DUF748 domain-containing protein [Bacteroidota bacterium]